MESRIERSGLYLKHISGLQTQSLDNAISMLRSPLQGLQTEHVECSLQQLNPVLILVFLVHRSRHSTPDGGRSSTSFCIARRAALPTAITCRRMMPNHWGAQPWSVPISQRVRSDCDWARLTSKQELLLNLPLSAAAPYPCYTFGLSLRPCQRASEAA